MTTNSIEDRLATLERIVPQAKTMAEGIMALVDAANTALKRNDLAIERLQDASEKNREAVCVAAGRSIENADKIKAIEQRIEAVEALANNAHRELGAKVNGSAFGAYAVGINETLSAIERKASDTAQKADRCFIELYKAVGKLSEALDVKLDEGADMVQDVQGKMQFIIVYGTAGAGFTFVGPFPSRDAARTYLVTEPDGEASGEIIMLQRPAL